MEVQMNQEISEKKISFLASRISGFNSFLFWFGKKVYSFLLGLIFIVFVGAGVYAFFIGGESVSVPDFDDQEELAEEMKKTAEEKKKEELKEAKLQKEFDEMYNTREKEMEKKLSRVLTEKEISDLIDEVFKIIYGEEKEEEQDDDEEKKK